MAAWDSRYKWVTSAKGPTDDESGFDSNLSTFRGDAYMNLAREIIQNSTDARDTSLPDNVPVKVSFELLNIDRSDIPYIDRLGNIIEDGCNFWDGRGSANDANINIIRETVESYIKSNSTIPVLKISDSNTIGLIEKNFHALLKSDGESVKNNNAGGAFGHGKQAAFRMTGINTILYSSRAVDGMYRFQGKATLATFADSEDNNRIKNRIVVFGEMNEDGTEVLPITNEEDVPELYRRTENGTDLYLLCFENTEDWLDRLTMSVLNNFFVAIQNRKLEVTVGDGNTVVEIKRDNLGDLIKKYEVIYREKYYTEGSGNFVFDAPKYWEVIDPEKQNDGNHFHEELDAGFLGKPGKLDLYFKIGDEVTDRSVLEMRNTCMRIRTDEVFPQLIPFNGVLIASSAGSEKDGGEENISEFLLKLETVSHDSWDANNEKLTAEEKEQAVKVLQKIHKWIRECIKAKMPKNDGKEVDAVGLSKYLLDQSSEGAEKIEISPFENFVPEETSLYDKSGKPVDPENFKASNSPGKKRKKKKKKDEEEEEEEPKKGGNKDPNNKQGTKPTTRVFAIRNIHTPYSSSRDLYRVSFLPKADGKDVNIKIDIAGEDSGKVEAIPKKAEMNGQALYTDGNKIIIPSVSKDQKVSFDVQLNLSGKYSLEVFAYVKK